MEENVIAKDEFVKKEVFVMDAELDGIVLKEEVKLEQVEDDLDHTPSTEEMNCRSVHTEELSQHQSLLEQLLKHGSDLRPAKCTSPPKPLKMAHWDIRPFKCSICDKNFQRKPHLKRHEEIHKIRSDRKYKCERCHQSYDTEYSLKMHVISHSGVLPRQCGVCLKRFKLSRQLNEHIRTHTVEGAYKCNICSKTFKQKQYLNKHLKLHAQKPQHLF